MIKVSVGNGKYQHEMYGDGMTLTAETARIIMGVYNAIKMKSGVHGVIFKEGLKALMQDEKFWDKAEIECAGGEIDVSGMTDEEIAAMKRERGFR